MTSSNCDHLSLRVEHTDKHGSEVEIWIACPDCSGYWTLTGDLDEVTAHISQDRDSDQAGLTEYEADQ